MKSGQRFFLVLSATLFVLWLVFLGYLALTAAHPIVLSRPQVLSATLVVVAQVEQDKDGRPRPEAQVLEVCSPAAEQEKPADRRIWVSNLPAVNERDGWKGPGRYILPLVRDGAGYRVATIPRSPGYDASNWVGARIYEDTPETREQLRQIRPGE